MANMACKRVSHNALLCKSQTHAVNDGVYQGCPTFSLTWAISKINQTKWADRVACRQHGDSLWALWMPQEDNSTHTYTMQAPSTMNLYTLYICLMYLVHGWIGPVKFAPKSVSKFAKIKLSHPKSQNEPRWLMSHRLGTPGVYDIDWEKLHCGNVVNLPYWSYAICFMCLFTGEPNVCYNGNSR